jgi:hypothetical protein
VPGCASDIGEVNRANPASANIGHAGSRGSNGVGGTRQERSPELWQDAPGFVRLLRPMPIA